ncbi:MAG: DUF4091 domain-containing protein [Candidatus Sumerlaeia bacterium]|nr:DUF4091 domain-containing protein [Candidatus Sumerlaeia bacterium]
MNLGSLAKTAIGGFILLLTGAATGAPDIVSVDQPRRPKRPATMTITYPTATPTSLPLTIETPRIQYTAGQIEQILTRAHDAWKAYLALRPKLSREDARAQDYANRAYSMWLRTRALEKIIASERRTPTRNGPQILSDGLTSLDLAVARLDYEHDRLSLRLAQEQILPPGQPFCLCTADAASRIPPAGPTLCPPSTGVGLSLARGESESFQLVIVPYWEVLRNVQIRVGPFYRRGGIEPLAESRFHLWLVESVATSSPLGRAGLWPDPLTPLRPLDIPATASQSVLVNVCAPREQAAGVYEGAIMVGAAGMSSLTLAVEIRVRSFALPHDPAGAIAFRTRNDYLQERFAADQSPFFIRMWERFLVDFGLQLYRRSGLEDAAEGWLPWVGEAPPLPVESLASDPYSIGAPTAIAFRQAGWAGWNLERRAPESPRRWLVNGWISVDPAALPPSSTLFTAPHVRLFWQPEKTPVPPGVIWVNPKGEPEPTLRLVALRDGIEDFRYLQTLSAVIREVEKRRAASWWTRRRWQRLLSVPSGFADPNRLEWRKIPELYARRDAIAEAIEEAQSILDQSRVPGR